MRRDVRASATVNLDEIGVEMRLVMMLITQSLATTVTAAAG